MSEVFMRNLFPIYFLLTLAAAPALRGQQASTPHLGYVFPAGGRQGASFDVKVGGQYLGAVSNAYVSGAGVQAVVSENDRPLTPMQINQLREQQKALQDKRAAAQAARSGGAAAAGQARPAWTAADMTALAEIRDKLLEIQARSANPALADSVTVKITIAPDAEPGERELRLGAPLALSQPLAFCVGQLPEFTKPKPPLILNPLARQPGGKRRRPDRRRACGIAHRPALCGQRPDHAGRRGPLPLSGAQGPAVGHRRLRPGTHPLSGRRGSRLVPSGRLPL